MHVGPFYETFVSRIRLVMRNESLVPYESRLCVSHWSNEDDRIRFLFSSYPTTCRAPPVIEHQSKPLHFRFGGKPNSQDTQHHMLLKRSASLTNIDTPKRDRRLSMVKLRATRISLLRAVSSSSLPTGH